MTRFIGLLAALVLVLGPGLAAAQTVSQPGGVSMSEVVALIPAPAAAVPPSETLVGAVGTAGTYATAMHTHPRITRGGNFLTTTGGIIAGTWTTPLPVAPIIVFTPIVTSGNAVECELTAAPTTSAFTGRCWTASNAVGLTVVNVTAGISVTPNAATAAGVTIQVLGIPPTQ